MLSDTVIELSRWQFAITAMFHFLFIPLSLGLVLFVALLESAYVASSQQIYKNMAQFWGRLLVIDFVFAVTTRLIMVFQFGINGSYFSHYVGDVFALPLAIEAMTSFFAAAALFGPYCFGWDRLGKLQHLLVTWLITIAVTLSAYWVLVANGWMQNPVGATFNYQSYRLELGEFELLPGNPVVISKFIHTLAAAYLTAAAMVMALSAYRLLRRGNNDQDHRSFGLAASLGLLAVLVSVGLGDATPDQQSLVQQAKRNAIQGVSSANLLPEIENRIRSGVQAFVLLDRLRDEDKDPQLLVDFAQHHADLGYGLLLKRFTQHINEAKDLQIKLAAQSALPSQPWLLFSSYRIMIACGIVSMLLFSLAVWKSLTGKPLPDWLLKLALYLAPLPWLTCITGWFVAEVGKQPWAIAEQLPTFLSISSLSVKELIISLIAYLLAYAGLLGICLFLVKQLINDQLPTSRREA